MAPFKKLSKTARIGIAAVLVSTAVAVALFLTARQSAQRALAVTATPEGVTGFTALPDPEKVPVLAYYYIWYDKRSWDRAKTDYPLLGPYSSDDRYIMRKHIRTAKAAGIDGFIVSWKSTDKLNPRLEQLVELSAEENFKLAIIFQGLDFYRAPQPAERIAADLDYFINTYETNPVFDIFGKPLVLWSGTWEFTREELQAVISPRRDKLLFLATEKQPSDYLDKSDLFDGNAYYWSSVNPETMGGYQNKLNTFADAVHSKNGLWIAPAAPGFDARLVGGTSVVERREGETLLKELTAARESAPDAIGLISWNEFSENTHIEPSLNFENKYIDILSKAQNVEVSNGSDFDSSSPGGLDMSLNPARLGAMAGLLGIVAYSMVVLITRRRQGPKY